MPTFLSDPPQVAYLVLAALLFLSGAVWFNRRDKKVLTLFLGLAGFTLILLLLDFSFESPREEVVRRVQLMVRAADAKNPEAFVEHLADTVEFPSSSNASKSEKREDIRKSGFWNLLRQLDVRIVGWDYSQLENDNPSKIELGFMAKGESGGRPFPVYIRATFTVQPDGKMKLTAFQTLNPVNRSEPLSIPNFP